MKKIPLCIFLSSCMALTGAFESTAASAQGSVLASQQQNRTVTGTVTSTTGEPLVGVAVFVQGTQIGTTTDEKGKFSLNVPSNATLTFSSLGYTDQVVSVGNRSVLNVTLAVNNQFIDESVVVGYGTMKKRDLTGAISQIKGDEINAYPLGSATDALQGRVAGVTITSTSGSPGKEGTVRIRGIGTINNNNPLYVIDGLPQTSASWLNPADIATVEVLKDASAQAIYGARAANGVILINTKRASVTDTYTSSVDFDMSIGIQNPVKMYDMLDAEGFIRYKNTAYQNAGVALIDDFSSQEKINRILDFLEANGSRKGTDWQDVIRDKNALVQNYNVSLSGGISKLNYRASFGYIGQDGTVKNSKFQRITGRINLDSQVFDWLKFTANVSVINSKTTGVTENTPYNGTVFSAISADPITPAMRNNLKDIPDFLESRIMNGYEPANPFSWYTGMLYHNRANPLAAVNRFKQNSSPSLGVKSNIAGEITILPYLKFRSSFGLDLNRSDSFGFTPKYYLSGDDNTATNTVRQTASKTNYWEWENYLTFDKTFDLHHVQVMVGTSAEQTRYSTFSASKDGLTNNDKSQNP